MDAIDKSRHPVLRALSSPVNLLQPVDVFAKKSVILHVPVNLIFAAYDNNVILRLEARVSDIRRDLRAGRHGFGEKLFTRERVDKSTFSRVGGAHDGNLVKPEIKGELASER